MLDTSGLQVLSDVPNTYLERTSLGYNSDKEIHLPTEELKNLLIVKNYREIINSSELFQSAFYYSLRYRDLNLDLSISEKDNQLHVRCNQTVFNNLSKIIELIRQTIQEAQQEKTCSAKIYAIEYVCSHYFTNVLSEEVILIELPYVLPKSLYIKYIQPHISDFSESLGLNYSEIDFSIELRLDSCFDKSKKNVKEMRFEFSTETNWIYPIAPLEILDLSVDELKKKFYDLYKAQKFCDYTLKTKEGEIALHSNILFINGGGFFQKLMTSGLKESYKNQVQLDYSIDVIKIFVDFLYLGNKVLEPEIFFQKCDGSHVVDLLGFAHYCQNGTLINCCTNLISLAVNQEDSEKVKRLAELYNNDHLRRLYEYYSTPTDPNAIKA